VNWIYIVFTGVMFGSLGLSTKYLTLHGIPAPVCAAVPFAVTAFLAVSGSWSRRRDAPWGEGIALGALNAGAPALLFNVGFDQLPASVVTIIIALGPVFTALTAHFAFGDDRFTRLKLAGLAVSFGGVWLLAGTPGSAPSLGVGLAATILGAVISGSSLVWVKAIAARYPPRAVLPAMMTGGAGITLAVATVTGDPPWETIASRGQWALLVAMGIAGLATYLGSLRANQLNPASRAGLMGYLVPLVGVGGGVLLFAEPVTLRLLAGGVLVIAGVGLVARHNQVGAQTAAG
jgi:drug/metabolite transporter (DMT)-like permease